MGYCLTYLSIWPDATIKLGSARRFADPLTSLGKQFLLFPAQNAHPYHFVAAQRHFATASGATPDAAVMANVTDAISKFCLQADVARGVHIVTDLSLLLPNGVLKNGDLVLFAPVKNHNEKHNVTRR